MEEGFLPDIQQGGVSPTCWQAGAAEPQKFLGFQVGRTVKYEPKQDGSDHNVSVPKVLCAQVVCCEMRNADPTGGEGRTILSVGDQVITMISLRDSY